MAIALALVNAAQAFGIAWIGYRASTARRERHDLMEELLDFKRRWGNGL